MEETPYIPEGKVDPRVVWFIQRVADILDLPNTKLIDEYLGTSLALRQMLSRFLQGGTKTQRLMWYFEPGSDMMEVESVKKPTKKDDYDEDGDGDDDAAAAEAARLEKLRQEAEQAKKAQRPSVIYLTDGHDIRVSSKIVYCLRPDASRPVELAKVDQDIVVGLINGPILSGFRKHIQRLLLPALVQQTEWGKLPKGESVSFYLDSLRKFTDVLGDAEMSLDGLVVLTAPKSLFNLENKQQDFTRGSSDPDIVSAFEEACLGWCAQVERLLAETDQVRQESEDTGPNAELQYWKSRMAKFNSIIDQLKSRECKIVIGVMTAAKSPLLQQWRTLNNRITDAGNEAKDNVKYLYTLEKFTEPLYKSDPVQMLDAVPGLISAIQMMQSIARYYNTSERLTALFVKITNQMIKCCKSYVMSGGELWKQEHGLLAQRLQQCIDLNECYQEHYRQAKAANQASRANRHFDVSEMYIFGKFDLFCKRVQKLIDFFSTIDQFSKLSYATKIDGMEGIIKKFNLILQTFQTRPYDLLDHRNPDFDNDYVSFLKQITDLEEEIQRFINECFSKITSTEGALQLLKQFQSVLQRENMKADLEQKYLLIFTNYGRDLKLVSETYEKHKENPPVPRNTTPVAGAISWSRQLLRRIETPMKLFRTLPQLMETPEAKRIIKTYNKLASVLISFETLWHDGWCKSLASVKASLGTTLFTKHPDGGQLCVNFDPQILQLMKETKMLSRMDLHIPENALLLSSQEDRFKKYSDKLAFALLDYERVTAKIGQIYKKLMKPHLDQLNYTINLGLTSITWSSLNIEAYIKSIHDCLDAINDIVDKANDILECRVDTNIRFITSTQLLVLPKDSETWGLSEFVKRIEKHVVTQAELLDIRSQAIERAVDELVTTISKGYTEEQMSIVEKEHGSLLWHFTRLNREAILSCVKGGLHSLKKLFQSTHVPHGLGFAAVNAALDVVPLFNVSIELSVPNVIMKPNITDIQQCLNEAAVGVLATPKYIYQWTDDRSKPHDQLENFYSFVSSNKEVVKVILLLTGSSAHLKKDVDVYLQSFKAYEDIWKMDRTEAFNKFTSSSPTLEDYSREMKRYDDLRITINDISTVQYIGCLSIDCSPIKQALKDQAIDWKQQFGRHLNKKVKVDMDKIVSFMEETDSKLHRKISDLDDVRQTMEVLDSLRELETEIDIKFAPIEESYALLAKYEISVAKEELEHVDNLRDNWKRLKAVSSQVYDTISKLQPGLKKNLVKSVKIFANDVISFKVDYDRNGPMVPGIKPRDALNRLRDFERGFEERKRKWLTYSVGEGLFGLPVTDYPELTSVEKELKLLSSLYTLYNDVTVTISGYAEILWSDLNLDDIQVQINEFQAKCRKLPKDMKSWDAYLELKKTIDDFVETLPLLRLLSDKSIRARHWAEIMKITKTSFKLDPELFKLGNLLDLHLNSFTEDVEEICNAATKEAEIEIKMKIVEADWVERAFTFGEFKERGNLILKGGETTDIVTALEDSLMLLGAQMSNRYNAPFKKDIQSWIHKLTTTSEVIERWLQVQALWIYLEAVFAGGDIARNLPKEAKKFATVDKAWVKIMQTAIENPNVITCCCQDENLHNLLKDLFESLEQCQKSLSGYLEKKRQVFPRFYFVSDTVLLEILGQASDSHSIQPHLKSVFDNIARVEFDRLEYNKILQIQSSESEKVNLFKPLNCEGTVETWLNFLVDKMKETMKNIIRAASSQMISMSLEEILAKFPAQVSLLGLQLMWTQSCEDALNKAKTEKGIMQLTNRRNMEIQRHLVDMTTKDLDGLTRVKIETLITIQVHQRDVFDGLVRQQIKSAADFEWQKQSRFYWKVDMDECIVSITDVDFPYCYEYLGCTDRLVITPLTDRCYITLAQAVGMCLGGAPAGPAGTGKTETVKDMGKALGKFVVVFNCSDQMDYKGLAKIFKGVAHSGCWGDFDEFNRINLEVLSVAAQQIATIFEAKKERKTLFNFTDGTQVPLDSNCGIFITMNPGYAGRQELPENMKLQFRSVAMMVPDRQIIMRVKLAAAGFQENMNLSQKFAILYRLCEQQLSSQRHYDFGLRNILSVLRTAGFVKRQYPKDSESTIMMRVLRDMNLSKLVDEDEPLFMSLLNDLFPNLTVTKPKYNELEKAIDHQVDMAGLINHPDWNLKIIQLYESSLVRHGVMVLGASGAGKTKCIKTLMGSLTEMGTVHKEVRMNPKAITSPQMFGKLDPSTNDWTDGIFSALWRKACRKRPENQWVWIILDGPVDAIWIENLNTVLDDNKTLTLANGDRIPMSSTLKLIFEVENLDNASPATVSRAGMIYMSISALGWKPVLDAWLKRRPEPEAQILRQLFYQHCDTFLKFITENCSRVMPVTEVIQVTNALYLLKQLIPSREENQVPTNQHLERLFVFCTSWCFGGLLESEDRVKFMEVLKSSGLSIPDVAGPSADGGLPETVFEYYVDEKGRWKNWTTKVEEYVYPTTSTPDFSNLLVPTVDSVRMEFLIDCYYKQNRGVLLVGSSGTAKTVTIKGFLSKFDTEQELSKCINLSSATTPELLQRTIEGLVDKRIGSTYGPAGGKRMGCFIDDISMPEINEWGDQITNELLRQLIEEGGLYSLDRPGEWTTIVDIRFLGAMIQPGGGRNDIPNRLKRQFAVFNCTIPSNQSIEKIWGTIVEGHFCADRKFDFKVIESARKLIPLTRRLWQLTKSKMLPTPNKFHYNFNLRDLSRITQGLIDTLGEVITTPAILFKLWKHECCRVLQDKFTNQEDIDWFNKTILEVMHADGIAADIITQCSQEPFFIDWNKVVDLEEAEIEPAMNRSYEYCGDIAVLKAKLEEYQKLYNANIRGHALDLVLFDDAIRHMVRISRLLRRPRGNALLVGVGGSGRQSLTRLATYIAQYSVFQITITKNYNQTNLMEDIKNLYKIAGGAGKGVSFIFTDNEIKEEIFLEYINCILSTGEIPGLFTKDDLDGILTDLRPIFKKEKGPSGIDTNENLYTYLIDRVRRNLHIILCFSPVGDKFRSRSLKFPGLISGCTIDWFSNWPKQALVSVAEKFLGTFPIQCTQPTREALISFMGITHDLVGRYTKEYFTKFRRTTFVTPKSYLSFINSYKKIYSQKRAEIGELAKRMNSGLQKLLEAGDGVKKMKIELMQKEKDLAKAQEKAAAFLVEITESTKIAEKNKASVLKVREQLAEQAGRIDAEKQQAERRLEAAAPLLADAEQALDQIKPGDIAAVKKLPKPPNLVKRIMDGVLVLRRFPLDPYKVDTEITDKLQVLSSWSKAMKMMGDSAFLKQLKEFDRDAINDETCELLEPYLRMEDFNREDAEKSAGAVSGLCAWVRAMHSYHFIAAEVEPMRLAVNLAEISLNAAKKELQKAQSELDEKQRALDVMKAKYDAAMREKQAMIDEADNCKRSITAATALIGALSGEKERWTKQSKEFEETINRLVGDVAIAAAFMSYSGPFNQEFRSRLADAWFDDLRKGRIPFTESLNVIKFLVHENTVGEWNLQGLPTDDLSTQNGIIVTSASRYPLLIDPQGQGKEWIKRREASRNLKITSLLDKSFRLHVEECLSFGIPILIEDVEEELDPVIDNVLEKNYIKTGRSTKVKLGDREIDVSPDFYLYITTKLANPRFSPEVAAKTVIIDFTVTLKGLEDQLLGLVILKEKAELEKQRLGLLEEVNTNKKKIQTLEDDLLFRLSNTQGNLLDDHTLVEVLATTKQTSEEVSEKLIVCYETEKQINSAREEFRPVAARGSILYFLVAEMSLVNHMYQTSLAQYLKLFDGSMERSTPSPFTQKRISNIIEYLTNSVHKYIARGLFEIHKLLFVLQMALKIDLYASRIDHKEYMCLIKGGAALNLQSVKKKPFGWITDTTWLNLIALSDLPQFKEIIHSITENESVWRKWYELEAPEEAEIPDGYESRLDKFRKLVLVRCWCQDRTMLAATSYITSALGESYVESVAMDLDAVVNETDTRTPIVCLLSLGSDPTSSISSLAKKYKVKPEQVSMGQGQDAPARRLINQAMQSGGWVILQNCHLGLQFLADEVVAMLLTTPEIHDDFKLWITTEPVSKFPINLLQMAVKLANEPPQGVRAGLKRTWNWITQETLDLIDKPQWRMLLYSLSFLHTTVQERRKFGPLGWNIPYEFNQSDLSAGLQFIRNHMDNMDRKRGIVWTNVRYMLCEVHYGGRVTDEFDRTLLTTYGNEWFKDEIFEQGFEFFKKYPIPSCKNVKEFREYIETIPLTDTPEIFGMHPNADITFRTNQASDILNTILNVQPKDSSGSGGESRESQVLAMAQDILSKLPADYPKSKVKEDIKRLGGQTPLNVFLSHEVHRIQVALTTIRRTLGDLQLAIAGTIVMNENLIGILNSLYDARVPPLWEKLTWSSSTLGFWNEDLTLRCKQYTKWLKDGQPLVFWLTGFYNPQGFLTSMRQEIARERKWALDTVKINTEVTKWEERDVRQAPQEGVYIQGLFIEGASWDKYKCQLIESKPKILYTSMPVIYVTASTNPPASAHIYNCPVYRTPQRTDRNYIFDVQLNTDDSAARWTMRGVALLCSKV